MKIDPSHFLTGHTYKIECNVYPSANNTNIPLYARAEISYLENTNPISFGGGLRVKSITDYDYDGKVVRKQRFKYGDNENGIGATLTNSSLFGINFRTATYTLGYGEGIECNVAYGQPTTIYTNTPTFAVSQISGTPVMYEQVTRYEQSRMPILAR